MMSRTLRLAVRFLRVAALEDRIQFLVKKFPSVSERFIRFLASCDPSGGKYLEYLVSQTAKGNLHQVETQLSRNYIEGALNFFIMIQQSKSAEKHLREIFGFPEIPD